MKKMCFMTVANEPYQQYIPWWLYFLHQAYPKAHKMVLLDGRLINNIQKILAILPGDFEIRENAFNGYAKVSGIIIQCLRWLTFDSIFNQFDCLSIGDVDMAICKESPSYMEQHLSHCKLLNLPYSNCVRIHSNPKRMGGIHVVKPNEWFDIMMPIIRLAEHGIAKFKKSKGYTDRKLEVLSACQTPLFKELATKSPRIGLILNQIVKTYGT